MATSLDNCELSMGKVDAQLIDHEQRVLPEATIETLWEIFQEIGRTWGNVSQDSAGLRSSWLEFIDAKTNVEPSYLGEYTNAVAVVQELKSVFGYKDAYKTLFFDSGVSPKDPPLTRLAHCKRYVVDEFIHVQITASGFRGFVSDEERKAHMRKTGPLGRSLNYHGFVRGSRYNERPVALLAEHETAKGGEG